MKTYKIEYDLTELNKLKENFARGMTTAAFPNTDAAFQRAAQMVRQMWVNYLSGGQLPGIDNLDGVTSAMVKSIKIKDNTNLEEFSQTVYSDSMALQQKVNGNKEVEYDMKKTHPYGKKSRVSKKGIPYLIIRFRWGTPNQKGTKRAHFNNVIPQMNYETSVKGLEISSKNELKNYFEKNFRGENIERQGYDWAKFGRLTEDQAWNDRSVGMVKMKDVTGSTYFTFRIISAKSPASSWIYKRAANPPVDVMGALQKAALPKIDTLINKGLEADLRMLTGQ